MSKSFEYQNLTPMEQQMATEDLSKLVLKMSIPTIIGMVVNALYNIVDRFWVGKIPNVGNSALAGLGLSLPIANILMGFAQLIGLGAATCISICLGQGNKDKAEKILGNSLVYILIISVFVQVTGLIFIEDILDAMKASATSKPFALDYLKIILAGSIFHLVSFAMNHPIRATGNSKRFAQTQLLGAITNIILDPIFIFVFNMEIKGAAYATIISQFVSAVWVISYYFTDSSLLKIKTKNLKPDLDTAMRIFSIGLAPFFMQVAASVINFVANRGLAHYGLIELGDGDIAIGIQTIIVSVSMMIFMQLFGINQASQPIIGFNYGMKNLIRVKEAYKYSVYYCVAISTFGFILIECFAPYFIKIFNSDPLAMKLGGRSMRIFLCAMPLVGMQIPTVNFFQAIGKAQKAAFLSLLRQVILLLPCYIFLPKLMGLDGLWYAGPVSDILASVITVVMMLRELKILEKELS